MILVLQVIHVVVIHVYFFIHLSRCINDFMLHFRYTFVPCTCTVLVHVSDTVQMYKCGTSLLPSRMKSTCTLYTYILKQTIFVMTSPQCSTQS